jgi:UDP-N-acetylmuramate: L-alanyl-gamma-D-glutamyl-meso-diaminopimelate ligase
MLNEEVNTAYPARSGMHFVGICGTAMASVAAMCRELGHAVTGSDENVYPPMSTFLESRMASASSAGIVNRISTITPI